MKTTPLKYLMNDELFRFDHDNTTVWRAGELGEHDRRIFSKCGTVSSYISKNHEVIRVHPKQTHSSGMSPEARFYAKELEDRIQYFYSVGGKIVYPNSAAGDLIRMAHKLVKSLKNH
jgi:hypothetical protein